MSMNINIREAVENRLTVESFQILKEMAEAKPNANGGLLEWFQSLITRAEATNDIARSIAATIVMKACAEEWQTGNYDVDRMTTRVSRGIQDTLR
jgi:hypothetical protein